MGFQLRAFRLVDDVFHGAQIGQGEHDRHHDDGSPHGQHQFHAEPQIIKHA